MRCHPVSQARRASQSSRCGSGARPGSTSPSHSRRSDRNCCSSAVYLRSIGPGAYLTRRQTPPARRAGHASRTACMQYVKLGRTGLDVSRICLGCMSYGDAASGNHPWALDEETSRPFYVQALEAGINFFDTANAYSGGTSEEFLGRALRDLGVNRDEVVVATKVFMPMRKGPNSIGLSRKAILSEVDHSLRRLGTDYIDLYQIHRLDRRTPMEELLQALDDVVRAGKVRYLGASSMWAWEFSKLLYTADAHGWTRFVSMQDHYNLLNREEEREMLPLCLDQGIGVIPWSPLARGRLARPWDESTNRSENDP